MPVGSSGGSNDAATKHPSSNCERVRRAPPAVGRPDRQMRALRFLPARVPHICAVERGDGFAARSDLPDEDGRRWRCDHQRNMGKSFRRLPGLHGLHDGVSFWRGLRETNRARIERRYARPASEKRFRRFLFSIFTHPARLRALLLPLRLYQKAGLEALVRRMGIPKLLPARLRTLEALLPQLPTEETLPELIPAQGDRRRRVGLLLGCVQRVLFSRVNTATARVLAAEGCEVVVPAAQPCCGALLVHAGEEEQALQLARQTIEAFES